MIRSSSGFTLLELMIAIAVIGIVSGFAIPTYSWFIQQARLNDGKTDVYTVLNQQDRFYMNNLRYTLNLGSGGLGYGLVSGKLFSPEGHFEMSAAHCILQNGSLATNVNNCIRIVATGNSKTGNEIYWVQSDGEKSSNLD